MKTVSDVLRADHARNYAGRAVSVDEYIRDFVKYVEDGKPLFTKGEVFIMFSDIGGGAVEFHCINGGSGRDLTGAVQEFLDGMSAMFSRAITFYDNQRITDLMKYITYKTNVERIDGGEDRTFMAIFTLKDQLWAH